MNCQICGGLMTRDTNWDYGVRIYCMMCGREPPSPPEPQKPEDLRTVEQETPQQDGYVQDGFSGPSCDESPSCFTCPLPKCKYEFTQYEFKELKTNQVALEFRREWQGLRDQGIPSLQATRTVAEQRGITERSGLRYLARSREYGS